MAPALISLVAVSAAEAGHYVDAKVRRPRRQLLNPARGTSDGIQTIVRSTVRNLQQDDESGRENAPYLSACIGRYPGYNLELGAWVNPNGHVRTIYLQDGGESGTEMLFEFDVYENEDHCKDCRIHIATGMTCEDADEVGGHYWNSNVLDEDPWTRRNGAFYNSNNNGKAIGAFEVDNGYSYGENVGHAVVIYAMDGRTKIGCGILEDGDRGMHCDPFADGSGERDDVDDDESSDTDDDSEISQDDQPSSPSSPSSPSASAPSPSAPSPSYSSDMSFDHGDRSDDEVKGDVKEHGTAEGIAGRRGHRDDSDEDDSDDESSITEESNTTGSKYAKSSKKSKGSSKKTKSSKSSKGNSSDTESTRYSEDDRRNKQSKHSSMSKESKQKATKSAKMVRRRQR